MDQLSPEKFQSLCTHFAQTNGMVFSENTNVQLVKRVTCTTKQRVDGQAYCKQRLSACRTVQETGSVDMAAVQLGVTFGGVQGEGQGQRGQ